MPLRVTQSNARVNGSPSRSGTPLSESESSFVSAQSENTSNQRPHIDQSPPLLTSSRLHDEQEANDSSSSYSSVFQEPTPLASKHVSSSAGFKSTPTKVAPLVESYFDNPPSPSASKPRSPESKRPPASRSSHGIETRSGPPPALSTRRSTNVDAPWRPPLSANPVFFQTSADGNIDLDMNDTHCASHAHSRQLENGKEATTGHLEGRAQQEKGSASLEDDQDSTLRVNAHYKADNQEGGRAHLQQEDLFLNLVRAGSIADDGSDSISRSERRRSRLGNSAQRLMRPSSSGRPISSGGRFFGQHNVQSRLPQSNSFDNPLPISSLISLRDDSLRDRPYAASAHPLDQKYHAQHSAMNSKQSSSSPYQENGDSALKYGRRRTINTTSHVKYNSSPIRERPSSIRGSEVISQARQGDGTESTVSTTAPSTVWDELDDLKSRIRKIEATGNLPSTSNAAISTVYGDRPVTATTTITNTSTSPKRRLRAGASPEASTIQEHGNEELHPLLRSSLERTKNVISSALYKALEVISSDALELAMMTTAKNSHGVSTTQLNASMVDRQIRRKVDSLCRSLTELCISLAESKSDIELPSRVLPASRGQVNPLRQKSKDLRLSRAVSEDPELRASSRVKSRLEARRTSLLLGQRSPQDSSPQPETLTPTQDRTLIASKFERTSSVVRRRDDDNESIASRRPASRAATEVGTFNPSVQTRSSREYTSQHPLPSPAHPSPSVQSSMNTRKSYFTSNSTQSPKTPPAQLGSRRYQDRPTPPLTESARLAEARQRRIASLDQGSLTKLASRNHPPNGRV